MTPSILVIDHNYFEMQLNLMDACILAKIGITMNIFFLIGVNFEQYLMRAIIDFMV